jgi:Cof subfamily protein (haloacid dehalogenase superfamily)
MKPRFLHALRKPMPATRSCYRLLFLDLDGTLVGTTDEVTPRTLRALEAAQERGCAVVICTGRNRYGAATVARQWRGHGYGIFSNGAVLSEWETGRVLHKIVLPNEVMRETARIAHAFGAAPICLGTRVETDGGRRVCVDRRAALWPSYAERNAHRLHLLDDIEADAMLEPVSMIVYGSPEQTRAVAAAWRAALGPRVTVFDASAAYYGCWSAYIHSAAADKALAAEKVAQMLGVPREQTLAIGDHCNDIGLLRWAGLGVCMGDGHEEARACADHVTAPLAEDGAAQVIERFVLGEG